MDSQLNAKLADLELGGDSLANDRNNSVEQRNDLAYRPKSFSDIDVANALEATNRVAVKESLENRDDVQSTWLPPEVQLLNYCFVLM